MTMDIYPGVCLWLFPQAEKGGCLSDINGTTYIFQPYDHRMVYGVLSKTPVYDDGFFPEPGKTVSFGIEFAPEDDPQRFGSRVDYRITSLSPLKEEDAEIADYEVLMRVWKEFESKNRNGRREKGSGLRTRTYNRI
jgi:hypothetical protein